MSFYLELHRAKDLLRDEQGYPYYWRTREVVTEFNDPSNFIAYVQNNIRRLKNVVAFSGSASQIASANQFITDQLKKERLL